jgi:hypothetical protein
MHHLVGSLAQEEMHIEIKMKIKNKFSKNSLQDPLSQTVREDSLIQKIENLSAVCANLLLNQGAMSPPLPLLSRASSSE